jgi:hypothetical protein
MDEICADRKGNHDILRIFRLKAEHPEKYREEVKLMNVEAPLKMLDKLAELAKKERAQRELEEPSEEPSVEGQYREVSTPMGNPLTTPPQSETLPAMMPQSPESSPKEPAPPAKRPARGKGSVPPPRAELPRQVRRF